MATCMYPPPYGERLIYPQSIRSRSRTGTSLTFTHVIYAVHFVYNISYPLAFLLTFVGFLTCGKISRRPLPRSLTRHPPTLLARLALFLMSLIVLFIPSWTLDLAALSARGAHKITHNASFVHPDNVSSTAPDPRMVETLIDFATKIQHSDGRHRSGLNLVDFARYRAQRELAAPAKLCNLHEQVALGEGALTWLVLRGSSDLPAKQNGYIGIVPAERVRQWLGEERLPDGWWDPHGVRPPRTIDLWRARHVANLVHILMEAAI